MSLSKEEQRRLDELEQQFGDETSVPAAAPGRAAIPDRRHAICRWLLVIGIVVLLLGLDLIAAGVFAGMIVTIYGALTVTAAAVVAQYVRGP